MSAHNPYWHCDTSLRGYVCRLLWFWTVYLYLFGVRVKWQYLILSLILSHPVLSITDLIHASLHISLILCDVPPTEITPWCPTHGDHRDIDLKLNYTYVSFNFLVYHPPHGPKWDITYLLHPDPRDITWVVFPNLGDIPVPFLPDRRNITAIIKITHGQPVGGGWETKKLNHT